jgi:hypothetical protein
MLTRGLYCTVEDIIVEAKSSRREFYDHFGSMEDLIGKMAVAARVVAYAPSSMVVLPGMPSSAIGALRAMPEWTRSMNYEADLAGESDAAVLAWFDALNTKLPEEYTACFVKRAGGEVRWLK